MYFDFFTSVVRLRGGDSPIQMLCRVINLRPTPFLPTWPVQYIIKDDIIAHSQKSDEHSPKYGNHMLIAW